MKQTIDLTPLQNFLNSKSDINELLVKIESLSEKIFKNGLEPKTVIEQNTGYEEGKAILKTAENSGINLNDVVSLEPFFQELQKTISETPVVHLILAIDPSIETVKSIHEWFINNYGKLVVLDLSIDESLIAGGIVSFGGRANDYSLKSKLEEVQL